jgi:hypothetical protein
MKKLALFLFSALTIAAGTYYFVQKEQAAMMTGPILYATTDDGKIFKIDVMNCTACPIANLTGIDDGVQDILVLPNGDILLQAGNGLFRYTLPNTNPIWSNNEKYGGSIIGANGIIYLSRLAPAPLGLVSYDPATNTTTYLGNWPANWVVEEFFYQNGVLYAKATASGNQMTVQIDLTNPNQSTIVHNNSLLFWNGGTTNGGYTTTVNGSGKQLHLYSAVTNTAELVCDLSAFLPGGGGALSGLTDLPAGVQEAPCLCSTFAGTVNNQVFNICVPGSVTVPYNNNATLDANDILRYILFSNTNDTLGSIIVQSSSATITFNPATMQTGVTYYLATLAGDNLNGNVDLNDPCLDISDVAAQLIWRDKPSVTFSVANPDVCAGNCTTVTANFTGVPPFNLTYTIPGSGPLTQTFAGNTGAFQVCVPPNAVPGSFQIAATGLSDGWCSCP